MYFSDFIYPLFLLIAQNCGMPEEGWSLVRHAPDDGTTWHPATDQLAGTHIYGNPKSGSFNHGGYWSVNFEEAVPNYDEILMATGDCSSWIVMKKEELVGSYYENAG